MGEHLFRVDVIKCRLLACFILFSCVVNTSTVSATAGCRKMSYIFPRQDVHCLTRVKLNALRNTSDDFNAK
jgi:hypothetical protein